MNANGSSLTVSQINANFLDDEFCMDDLADIMISNEGTPLVVKPEEISAPSTFNSGPSSTASYGSKSKVSPLIAVQDESEDQLVDRMAQTSLRGTNAITGQPVYSSSQTPHGNQQILTKRKTGKKSVFNFEGFDNSKSGGSSPVKRESTTSPSKGLQQKKDHSEQFDADFPLVQSSYLSSPEESPADAMSRRYFRAKPHVITSTSIPTANIPVPGTGGVPSILNAPSGTAHMDSQEPSSAASISSTLKKPMLVRFDSNDETVMKTNMQTFSTDLDYINALKEWNGLSPGVKPQTPLPAIPTPKNPRKKLDAGSEKALISSTDYNAGMNTEQFAHSQSNYSTDPSLLQTGTGAYSSANNSFDLNAQLLLPQHNSQSSYYPSSGQYYAPSEYPMHPAIPQLQQLPSLSSIPSINQLQYNQYTTQEYLPNLPTLQHAAVPLSNATASAELQQYQEMLQRRVQELKMQQYNQAQQHHYNQQQQQLQQFQQANVAKVANNTSFASSTGTGDSSKNNSFYTNDFSPSQPAVSSHDANDDFGSGQKEEKGKRAAKSLAEISKRFVQLYGKDNTMDYIAGKVDPNCTTGTQLLFYLFL